MGLGCFGCFAPEVDEDLKPSKHDDSSGADARRKVAPDVANGYAHSFTFKDLLVATGYFNEANFIGEGGFGKVYKGKINGQMVAVKQLARDGVQGRNEFLVEVLMLTVLNHRNLVSLVGFCAQGDERLLVYEYMPFGSLESHLFGADRASKHKITYLQFIIASNALALPAKNKELNVHRPCADETPGGAKDFSIFQIVLQPTTFSRIEAGNFISSAKHQSNLRS